MSAVFSTFRVPPPQIGVSPHFVTYDGPPIAPKSRRIPKQRPLYTTSQQADQQAEVDRRSVLDLCLEPEFGGGEQSSHGIYQPSRQPLGADAATFSPELLEAIFDDSIADRPTSAANLDDLWADNPADWSKTVSSANQSGRDLKPNAKNTVGDIPEARGDQDTFPAVENGLKRGINQVDASPSPPAKRLCPGSSPHDVLDSQIWSTPVGPPLDNSLLAERYKLPPCPDDNSTPDEAAIPEPNPTKLCTSPDDIVNVVDDHSSNNAENYNKFTSSNNLSHGDECREVRQDHDQDNGRPDSPAYLAPPSIKESDGREDGVQEPIEGGDGCTRQDDNQEVEDDERGDIDIVKETVISLSRRKGSFRLLGRRCRPKTQLKTMRQAIDASDSEIEPDSESSPSQSCPQPLPYQPFTNATKSSVGGGDVQQRAVHISLQLHSPNEFDLSAAIYGLPNVPSNSRSSQPLVLLESILGGAPKLDDISIKRASSGAWLVTGLYYCDSCAKATPTTRQSPAQSNDIHFDEEIIPAARHAQPKLVKPVVSPKNQHANTRDIYPVASDFGDSDECSSDADSIDNERWNAKKNTPWSRLEEERLLRLKKADQPWDLIFNQFPERTPGSVRTRWYTKLKAKAENQSV